MHHPVLSNRCYRESTASTAMYRVSSLHLRFMSEDGGELVGEVVGELVGERNGFLLFNGEDEDDFIGELVGDEVLINLILNQR